MGGSHVRAQFLPLRPLSALEYRDDPLVSYRVFQGVFGAVNTPQKSTEKAGLSNADSLSGWFGVIPALAIGVLRGSAFFGGNYLMVG
jgi:hypothetical protein